MHLPLCSNQVSKNINFYFILTILGVMINYKLRHPFLKINLEKLAKPRLKIKLQTPKNG
jgi:hypothetical protein